MHEETGKQTFVKMTITCQNILPLCIIFLSSLSEVLAEICASGKTCSDGQTCCATGCCYDNDDDNDRRYTYGYRLSIWNMWYFWFVVLFILMSCFGGCGYYKQRQRVIRNQPGVGHGFLSVFQVVPRQTRRQGNARVVTLEPAVYPPAAGYGYSHSPDIVTGVSMAPPPYSEVVSNPGQFPVNTKSGPPAHPGQQQQQPYIPSSHTGTNEPANQMPQPPPYTEVANQYPCNNLTPNQPSPINNPSTNQN